MDRKKSVDKTSIEYLFWRRPALRRIVTFLAQHDGDFPKTGENSISKGAEVVKASVDYNLHFLLDKKIIVKTRNFGHTALYTINRAWLAKHPEWKRVK